MKVDCPACSLQFEWPGDEWPETGIPCPGCEQVFWKPAAATMKYSATSVPELSPGAAELRPETARDDEILMPGSLVGQYRIEGFVGRGGMGSVYKARHTMLDRTVALKVLPARYSKDEEFVRRFRREALALANLSHPNIVAVHDMGVQGELYFLVMEFVEGVNLRDVLVHKKLSPEQALRVVPQLCDALEYAHSKGIIHRDIKPENILLERSGSAKIADFGLAKIVKGETSIVPLTQTNVIMGTVEYMAPEQRDSLKAVDHRADIFSLGVVLYELLTGELPMGKFDLPSRRVQVDVRIDDVVLRALEKDPQRRYQRASHMGTDVTQVMTTPPPPRDCAVTDLKAGKAIGTAAGRRLAVRASECDIEVNGWSRNEFGIETEGDYLFNASAPSALLQSQPNTGSVKVFVPRGAVVDVIASGGDLTVGSVAGELTLSLSEGDLSVSSHEGELKMSGGTCDVEINGIKTENLEVGLGNGDISVSGLELVRGRADLQTGNGDIEVSAASAASFRYHLETGTGDVGAPGGSSANPAEGQVGAGAASLSASAGNGDVSLSTEERPPLKLPSLKGLTRLLTPKQVEKIGVYVIVNLALFLFFGLVAGTLVVPVIVSVFWGMALALEVWKSYVRGTPHREPRPPRRAGAEPATVPARETIAPRPRPPRASVLAVITLILGALAALQAAGAAIALFVEHSLVGRGMDYHDLEAARIVEFVMGAIAVGFAVMGLAFAMAAGPHLRESKGRLRGKAAVRIGGLLAAFATAIVVALVVPHLLRVSEAADGARRTGERFIRALRYKDYKAAMDLMAPQLRETVSEEKLATLMKTTLEKYPRRWEGVTFDRARVSPDGRLCMLRFYSTTSPPTRMSGNLELVHRGEWRVTAPRRFWELMGATDHAGGDGTER